MSDYQLTVIALGAIAFGIYMLIKGGDVTIDAATHIAEKSGLSKLFIAATIIAFGTSAPELFTSINANLGGFVGISVGNVIGSNIANILLVLGVAAIIAPVIFNKIEVRVDTAMMVFATAVLSVAVYLGVLPRMAGIAMVLSLAGYIFYQYKTRKIQVEDDDGEEYEGNPYVKVTLGIVTLLVGAEILVQGAVAGGVAIGVPEAIIGMTVIAFGTSLPELTACVAAARKGQSEIIIGGIVGSNIFNIMSVLAITAVAKPLVIDPNFTQMDLPIVIAVTLAFSFFLLVFGKIGRLVGISMLVLYMAFILAQYSTITI